MNRESMPERKLTISEVVQFDIESSSCCVQSRESPDRPSANNDNLLRRHASKVSIAQG